MKKVLILIQLFIFLFSFSQKINFISPELSKEKLYKYTIKKSGYLFSDKGSFYHKPAYTNQDIELSYLFNDNKDKIFGWRITAYEHLHDGENKCNCEDYQYRNDIYVIVRTDSLGRYKTINNLYQVKKNILDNISQNEKILTRKKIDILSRIKKNPEIIISDIEKDIISFFRYYGIEEKAQKVTAFARRNSFPFSKSLPFITKLSVENFDKETDIILNNEFDRKSAQDDDYNYVRLDKNFDKEKYKLTVDEDYKFSKIDCKLLYASIKVREESNFHDNGIYNYQLSIIEKE